MNFVPPSPVTSTAELSVVIPCYNERDNVEPLVARLSTTLAGVAWEAIFVDDDSPDGTAAQVRLIARNDPRIRCLRRIGRRGLASAVIEGALASSAEFIAVMDGDLQHDETKLPVMLAVLQDGCDLAVGSRYAAGGSADGLSARWRHTVSDLGIGLAKLVLPNRLSDPMSGFFMLRRSLFERLAPRLTGQGFKILLDLLLSSPTPLRLREVPVLFQARIAGESKLDVLIMLQFAGLLVDKTFGGLLPLRFISFGLVGLIGVGVHLAVLQAARSGGLAFDLAQIVATYVAMLGNFFLNNSVTYRSVRLRGQALVPGLTLFIAVCSFGAIAGVGLARMIYAAHGGWTPSALLGAAVGAVWNYAISATLIWNRRQVRPSP